MQPRICTKPRNSAPQRYTFGDASWLRACSGLVCSLVCLPSPTAPRAPPRARGRRPGYQGRRGPRQGEKQSRNVNIHLRGPSPAVPKDSRFAAGVLTGVACEAREEAEVYRSATPVTDRAGVLTESRPHLRSDALQTRPQTLCVLACARGCRISYPHPSRTSHTY
jgi:hypothetical protein